jgi:ankyrin repeat protein
MVEWLLDHKADLNARCDWDYTPMSAAVYSGPLEIIDYLLSRGADVHYGQLLHFAVIRDKPDTLEVVRRLVERNAPLNEIGCINEWEYCWTRAPFGLGTPLHRAAEVGQTDVVKYLLEQGADPLKLCSKEKTTPRYWAEWKNNTETAKVLKEAEGQKSSTRSLPSETSNL